MCAFVDSILQVYRVKTGNPQRVGLYTSPHLKSVRERIQINSKPISEKLFAKYFYEVWEKIEAFTIHAGLDLNEKPGYFCFLTLMSFHVFLNENIDVAIYETGVGGEDDSTNVIEKPIVTGITTLGIDHVKTLGLTIKDITWHKARIFKSECPTYSAPQIPQALEVLYH